jgi:hypothetical protein
MKDANGNSNVQEPIYSTFVNVMTNINCLCNLAAAFDPKPFIRTFESVLEELQLLKTRVQEQCNELESSTQSAELEYKRNITDLHGAFDVSINNCKQDILVYAYSPLFEYRMSTVHMIVWKVELVMLVKQLFVLVNS